MKTYEVKDLFFTDWKPLKYQHHAEVYAFHQRAQSLEKDDPEFGFLLISILRRLRKWDRLVDKLDESQAVDIYNDLKFLDRPWYFFPHFPGFISPAEYLAKCTFDQFIFADHEFTSYIAKGNETHLFRLAATVYKRRRDEVFDKDNIEERAAYFTRMVASGRLKTYHIQLVFFTYGHVRNFIISKCKTLIPKSEVPEGSDLVKPVPTGVMWTKIKHLLAETTAFAGFDNAGRANMYSALGYLEDVAQRNEKK